VKAARDKRFYLAPNPPFGGIGASPSAVRVIGLRWLGKVPDPELFPADLRARARRHHRCCVSAFLSAWDLVRPTS
jgi:hypothetical protein